MDGSVPLIIKDMKNNLWGFRLSEDGDLLYSIAPKGGTIKDEGRINSGVLEFSADIDKDGTLHIIYVNKRGELGYGQREDGQWSSKTIHRFKTSGSGIRELALFVTDKCINMTYILQKWGTENTGVLCCSQWNGGKHITQTIGEIKLFPDVRTHYQIEARGQQDVSLFFIDNTGKKAIFKSCKYQNNVFAPIDLLFVLRGKCIDFFMARRGREVHFLELIEDSAGFMLKDVCLGQDGKVISIADIFKCNLNISGPALILSEGIFWAFWVAGEKVFFSSLKGQWTKAGEVKTEPERRINMYYCIERPDNRDRKTQRIFGTNQPGIKLLLPPRAQENAPEARGNPSPNKENARRQAMPALKSSGVMDLEEQEPGGQIEAAGGQTHLDTLPGRQEGFRKCYAQPADKWGYYMAGKIQMDRQGGWDRELLHNQLILSQENTRLEGECTELKNINMALRSEIDSLKKQADASQEQISDLESSKENKIEELQEKIELVKIEDARIIEEIEERCGVLLQEKFGLEQEINKLIRQLGEEQIRARSLEGQKNEIIKRLEDELEFVKNKGIFRKLLKILE